MHMYIYLYMNMYIYLRIYMYICRYDLMVGLSTLLWAVQTIQPCSKI